jgi:hypothetical protein
MQAARRSPRSVAVDEIQQEVGLPHVTAVSVPFAQLMVATKSDALPDVCWLGITHMA